MTFPVTNVEQDKAKSLHTYGLKASIFDAEILNHIGQTEHWTFAERIDMICRVLKVSL